MKKKIILKASSRGRFISAIHAAAVTLVLIAGILLAGCTGVKSVPQGAANAPLVKLGNAESTILTNLHGMVEIKTGDGQFYILALSQNEIRLLRSTRYSVSQIDIGQVAGSLADAIPSANHQMSQQLHSSGSTGGMSGRSSATFHGQGDGSGESDKNELLRYFRLVSDGLTEFLQGDRVPLVLAGVEYLLPIYKEANTYPNLIDTVITGNHDLLSAR